MCAGAAGNFLAPISLMSENAFRTVMEIDTVPILLSLPYISLILFARLEPSIPSRRLSLTFADPGVVTYMSAQLYIIKVYFYISVW